MSDILTVDEGFFDLLESGQTASPTIVPKQETVVEETVTQLPKITSSQMNILSEEDLDEIDSKGQEVNQEDVVDNKIVESVQKGKTEEKTNLYSQQVEYFKQKGLLPEQLELEEGQEWDEDSFEEALNMLTDGLQKNIETGVRGEFESKLGTNILQFLEDGGDYSTFAELIKEQNVVYNFDISTDNGQKEIVRKYYVEELGWSAAKTDRHIDRLFNDGELEEESADLKVKYDKYFEEQQEELIVKQQDITLKKEKALASRKNTFAQNLQETGVLQKDISVMVDYVFKDSWEFSNGTKVSQLDYDILMLQKNPKELAELVSFLNDKDNYLKKKSIEINNVKVDKKFKEIVQNKVSIKGSGLPDRDKPVSKFKTIIN